MFNFKKKIYYYLLGGVAFIFLSFVIQLLFSDKQAKQPEVIITSPEPSAIQEITDPKPRSSQKYQEANEEFIRRESLVGKLLDKLPYFGNNFSLKYDISSNRFTATIKQGSEEAGQKQLNEFLSANGIEDQSWIRNLDIVLAPIVEKDWILKLPLKNTDYYVNYSENENKIIATIYTFPSFSISKEDEIKSLQDQIKAKLTEIGVNINQEKIEWVIK